MICRQVGRQADDRQTEKASKTEKEDATCMTDSEKPFSEDHYEVSVLANASWWSQIKPGGKSELSWWRASNSELILNLK